MEFVMRPLLALAVASIVLVACSSSSSGKDPAKCQADENAILQACNQQGISCQGICNHPPNQQFKAACDAEKMDCP
jgi:hypothetical protein